MELRPVYLLVFSGLTSLALLLLFRLGQRLLSPKHTVREDLEHNDTARALLQVGQVFGIFLIAGSVVAGCVTGESLRHDVLWVALYGVLALTLLSVFGHLGVRLLVRSRLPAEIERGNIAAGLAGGAHYLATGIITARAISGNDFSTVGVALVFFVLSQITLHLVKFHYCQIRLTTRETTHHFTPAIQGKTATIKN